MLYVPSPSCRRISRILSTRISVVSSSTRTVESGSVFLVQHDRIIVCPRPNQIVEKNEKRDRPPGGASLPLSCRRNSRPDPPRRSRAWRNPSEMFRWANLNPFLCFRPHATVPRAALSAKSRTGKAASRNTRFYPKMHYSITEEWRTPRRNPNPGVALDVRHCASATLSWTAIARYSLRAYTHTR
jgi:hypothetical protein